MSFLINNSLNTEACLDKCNGFSLKPMINISFEVVTVGRGFQSCDLQNPTA